MSHVEEVDTHGGPSCVPDALPHVFITCLVSGKSSVQKGSWIPTNCSENNRAHTHIHFSVF